MDTKSIWIANTGITDIDDATLKLASSETPSIQKIWREQKEKLKGTRQLSEFTQRLGREWAIETGIIENLYEIDRGLTQTLIEHGFRAELMEGGPSKQPREYVLQLLRDQKEALDGIFDFVANRRSLSVSYIKEMHAALLRSQTHVEAIDSLGRHVEVPLIKGEWKASENYPIRDGIKYLYCPPAQVASEMERLVQLHTKHCEDKVPPDIAAAWLHHRFTQIHPFQDGNGRVARALASLVLVQADLFPLTISRDRKAEYITALEEADNGALHSLIEVVAQFQRSQFRKALAISENVIAERVDVQGALDALIRTVSSDAKPNSEVLSDVLDLSRRIESDLAENLRELSPKLTALLKRKDRRGVARIAISNEADSHYFKAQIMKNAETKYDYQPAQRDYASWVALNMSLRAERRARLVFAFHGIGRPFSGSLVCAPFWETTDYENKVPAGSEVRPIASEPFIFFYNENAEFVIDRFRPWRDEVLKMALHELGKEI